MSTLHHPGFPQLIRTRSGRYSLVLEYMSVQSMDAKDTSERSMEKASVSGSKTRAKVQNKQPLVFRCNNNPLFHFLGGDGWTALLTKPLKCSTKEVLCYVRRTVCKAFLWGLTTPAIYRSQAGLCLRLFHRRPTFS